MFDVDAAEGAPALKLPMDNGEDPYDVAERFLMTHGLPDSYLEQVVDFINENTGKSCALLRPHEYASTNGKHWPVDGHAVDHLLRSRKQGTTYAICPFCSQLLQLNMLLANP